MSDAPPTIWAFLDVRAPRNEKLEEIGGAAAWYWACGLCYCRGKEAERHRAGKRVDFISKAAALTLYADPKAKEHVREIVRVGLWIDVDGGYEVHDYHEVYATSSQPATETSSAPARQLTERQLAARSAGGRARAATSNRAGGKFQQSTSNGPAKPPAAPPAKPATRASDSGSGPGSESEGKVVAEDMKANKRAENQPKPPPPDGRGKLAIRLIQRSYEPGEQPPARHDPTFEKLPFSSWFPSKEMMAFCTSRGLSDQAFDAALIEARDGISGRHDFEWFDLKVWRYLDVAIDRAARGGRQSSPRLGGAGMPNTGAVGPEDYR